MYMWISLFIFLFSISINLQCTEEGYQQYLKSYPFKESNSESGDYQLSLNAFITNCNFLLQKQSKGDYAEESIFLDWSDENMESLSTLTSRFSGISSYFEPIQTSITQYTLQRSSRQYLDESLMKYSTKQTICSTSWATSVIEAAEAALDNKYEFSVDQLLQCLPQEYELDNNCQGVEPKTIMSYLKDVGLVRKKDFVDCNSMEYTPHIKFEAILPEAPNKSGLMNLVAEGKPVFVMMAMNLEKLRYVKDMSNVEKPLRAADYQPTMYGIVRGYNAEALSPYWDIVSNLVPAEEVIIRVPMTANETNTNYAAIAGYAFSLSAIDFTTVFSVNEEKYPFIEDIPDYATEITFEENSYPDETYLDLSIFPELVKVVFKSRSFANADTLYISNPYLEEKIIGDGCFNGNHEDEPVDGSRRLASRDEERRKEKEERDREWRNKHDRGLTIHDGRRLKSMEIGAGSMTSFEKTRIVHINVDIAIHVGDGSLTDCKSVEIPTVESIGVDITVVATVITNTIVEANPLVEISISVDVFVPKPEELIVPDYPTEAPTEEPTMAPTEALTEEPTMAPTEAPTEEPTISPTEALTEEPTMTPTEPPILMPTPTPTPTPEPWFPIYDPFILGDNCNYYDPNSSESFPSDLDILQQYLAVRDAYPTKALKHTRVLALAGMMTHTIQMFDNSLAAQTEPALNNIDCYFYGDYLKTRYLSADEIEPLLRLTRFTHPKRLVFANGVFYREGFETLLHWMSEHKEYYQDLEYFEVSRLKIHAYAEGTTAEALNELTDKIIGHLKEMCNATYYPKLTKMVFNNNGYNEDTNHAFQTRILEACKDTHVSVVAEETYSNRNAFPKMCGGSDAPAFESYTYYDLSVDSTIVREESDTLPAWTEKDQCRFTWNWEFGTTQYNDYSPEKNCPFNYL